MRDVQELTFRQRVAKALNQMMNPGEVNAAMENVWPVLEARELAAQAAALEDSWRHMEDALDHAFYEISRQDPGYREIYAGQKHIIIKHLQAAVETTDQRTALQAALDDARLPLERIVHAAARYMMTKPEEDAGYWCDAYNEMHEEVSLYFGSDDEKVWGMALDEDFPRRASRETKEQQP